MVGANRDGSLSFSTGGLAAGNYAAWYCYADGYSVLAGPMAFTLTNWRSTRHPGQAVIQRRSFALQNRCVPAHAGTTVTQRQSPLATNAPQ